MPSYSQPPSSPTPYVALPALKAYLYNQYGRRMNGKNIATHSKFGQNVPGAVSYMGTTFVPLSSIVLYLRSQYRGRYHSYMNAGPIVSHRKFLRSIPTVTFGGRSSTA